MNVVNVASKWSRRCWTATLNSLSENIPNNQVNDYASSNGQYYSMDKNIIIRNLPYGQNENLSGKVDGLFRDGLRIVDVVVDHVERKESRSESAPGVVVVTLVQRKLSARFWRWRNILLRVSNINMWLIIQTCQNAKHSWQQILEKWLMQYKILLSNVSLKDRGWYYPNNHYLMIWLRLKIGHTPVRVIWGIIEHSLMRDWNPRAWIRITPILINIIILINNCIQYYGQVQKTRENPKTVKMMIAQEMTCPPLVVTLL